MNETTATYARLARNQIRAYSRGAKVPLPLRMVVALLGILTGVILFKAGSQFGHLTRALLGLQAPVRLVNDYLLPFILATTGIRLLMQRTPPFDMRPYLHLPIRRQALANFFQISSSLTWYTALPLAFVLPFWATHLYGEVDPIGAWYWLIAVVSILVSITWVINALRAMLSRNGRFLAILLLVSWATITIDQLTGSFVLNDLSRAYFGALQNANHFAFLVLMAALGLTYRSTTRALLDVQRETARFAEAVKPSPINLSILSELGDVGSLIRLELKMIWRNRRPKHYLVMSILFSSVYLVAILANPMMGDAIHFGAIVGLFASGGFALNYGQLMFAWESAYFDGLFARRVDSRAIIQAKLLLLQVSCFILFVLSVPLFLLFKPELLLLHVAFLLYDTGVVCALVLLLALQNRQRVHIERSGAFFNYEGYSIAHWLWIIPTAVPPVAIMYALRHDVLLGFMVIGLLGAAGTIFSSLWVGLLTAVFDKRRYSMAASFRSV